MIKIMLPGPPVPLARPRFSGKLKRTYDPQKTIKHQYQLILQSQLPPAYTYTQYPKSIIILFYMPIPKHTPKYKKRLLSDNAHPHYKKPDIDNLIKFILDISSGILFHDDAQVSHIDAHKIYDIAPRTCIAIQDIQAFTAL